MVAGTVTERWGNTVRRPPPPHGLPAGSPLEDDQAPEGVCLECWCLVPAVLGIRRSGGTRHPPFKAPSPHGPRRRVPPTGSFRARHSPLEVSTVLRPLTNVSPPVSPPGTSDLWPALPVALGCLGAKYFLCDCERCMEPDLTRKCAAPGSCSFLFGLDPSFLTPCHLHSHIVITPPGNSISSIVGGGRSRFKCTLFSDLLITSLGPSLCVSSPVCSHFHTHVRTSKFTQGYRWRCFIIHLFDTFVVVAFSWSPVEPNQA